MPSAQMVFDVIARDGASGSFRAMSREANGAAASFDKVGKAAAGITVLFAAFAVNAAVKFESAMTRISTQAGVPIGQIKALSTAILGLSPKVGFNPDELATSLYHVESAFRTTGITAGKAIDIVEQASKLAKIGNANLEDTTQAIIGTLASKIKGVKDAADAAAQLNQLVGTGDTTLEAVTKAIGTGVLPVAQTLGLSFKDISAALATLSDNATPIDEAATRFRTTLSVIANGSPKAQAALQSIGISSTQLADDFRQPNGLLVAMDDLSTHLNKVYPLTRATKLSTDQIAASTKSYVTQLEASAVPAKTAIDLGNKYAESLKKGGTAATQQAQLILQAFGGAKSGATFLTLYDELDRLRSKYADAGTSVQAMTKFQEAWANQQKTAKQKLDELDASWHVFLVQAGNEILPTLKRIVDVLAKHPGIIKAAAAAVGVLAAAWTVSKFASAFSVLGRLTAAILGVGTASTTAATEAAAANLGGAATRGAAAAEGAGAAGLAGRGAAAGEGAAAAGEGGLIARLLGGGVTLGPIAVGIAGIAAGIHEIITDGQIKNLPALDQLAKLIAGPGPGSGLKGIGPAEAVGAALSTAKTGNNRGENIQNYLTRTLGSDVAAKNGLSYQKFFKIIQSGTQDQLTDFIAAYRSVEFQLKGSPNTIQKVDDYLQGLFSRFNSARVAAGELTKQQKLQAQVNYTSAVAAKYLSTNVDDLSKTYHVSSTVAKQLAADNFDLKLETIGTVNAMKGYGVTLDKNTTAGKQNINQIAVQSELIKANAKDVLKLTGNQDLANIALRSGAAAFEDAAVKAGFNRDQVKTLVDKLLGIPPNPTSTVHVNGIPEASAEVASFQFQLNALAQPIIVPIQVQSGLLGVASPNFSPTLPQILAAQNSGGFGGSGPGGIAGGTGHAKGGIASGWSWIGEKGPELVHFGSPSRVLTHEDSVAAVSGRSGPLVSIGEFHAHDEVDVAGVAQQIAFKTRAVMASRRL